MLPPERLSRTHTHEHRHKHIRHRQGGADASVNGDSRGQCGEQMVERTTQLERIGRGKSISTSQSTANVHTGTPSTTAPQRNIAAINEQLRFNNRKRRESHHRDDPGKFGGGGGGEE